jgi:hypothetical protein
MLQVVPLADVPSYVCHQQVLVCYAWQLSRGAKSWLFSTGATYGGSYGGIKSSKVVARSKVTRQWQEARRHGMSSYSLQAVSGFRGFGSQTWGDGRGGFIDDHCTPIETHDHDHDACLCCVLDEGGWLKLGFEDKILRSTYGWTRYHRWMCGISFLKD